VGDFAVILHGICRLDFRIVKSQPALPHLI